MLEDEPSDLEQILNLDNLIIDWNLHICHHPG